MARSGALEIYSVKGVTIMRNNNRAILSPEDVKQIRKLKLGGTKVSDIHKKYPQVTIWAIYKILSYQSWPLLT